MRDHGASSRMVRGGLAGALFVGFLLSPLGGEARRKPAKAKGSAATRTIRSLDFKNQTYPIEKGSIRLVKGVGPKADPEDPMRLSSVTHGMMGDSQECALIVLSQTNSNVGQDNRYYYLASMVGGTMVMLWRGVGGRGEETHGVQEAALMSKTLIVDEVRSEARTAQDPDCADDNFTRKTYLLTNGKIVLKSSEKFVLCEAKSGGKGGGE